MNDYVCAVQTRSQCRDKFPKRSNIGGGPIQLDMISLTSDKLIELQKSDKSLLKFFDKGYVLNLYFEMVFWLEFLTLVEI